LQRKSRLRPIGQAAKEAGISRQSLQYYIMLGLVEPAEVTQTGRRLFDDENIRQIRIIKGLNEVGYPLREIREMFLQGHTDLKGKKK